MTTKIHKSHLALLKLIEKEGNNSCADCGASGTRWASWNLGIFLCIRCAGIHRNLGVHISKVKSVDLDSWTAEQMESMEIMGNKKSQQIFEAALPDFFMRPQTNYSVEEFIRAKYQHKRYCAFKETPINTAPDVVIESAKDKIINDDSPKNLVNFQVSELESYAEGSDDSLSDPDYLVQQIRPNKSCHKVYSEGDLISFDPTSKTSNNKKLMSTNNKSTILSLYNQGYQTSGHDMVSCYHKSYGSSTDSAYYSTTNIPIDSQSNYLRQIQEKLTNLKVNLTAKFRQYEQPSNISSFTSNSNGNSNVFQKRQVRQDAGQTLSPDLWK